MTFCKDCRHYEKSDTGASFDKCYNPAFGIDPVRGERIFRYCDTARNDANGCGPEAVQFAPRIAAVDPTDSPAG